MRASVVTYIYPNVVPFLGDLILSLNNQTYSDFNLIVFNDGAQNIDKKFKNLNTDYTVFNVVGSINQIRFESLKTLNKIANEFIIFQDADDTLSINRLEVCIKYLSNNDIVVNDLSTANENLEIMYSHFWKSRLKEGFEIGLKHLTDYNIVGLGNTSVRKSILKTDILFSDIPIVFDWFLFYQIFEKNKKLRAVFTSQTTMIYRQHLNNTAGFKAITVESLKHIKKVKINHFLALNEIGYDFTKNLDNLIEIDLYKKLIELKNTKTTKNYFWWEEIKTH